MEDAILPLPKKNVPGPGVCELRRLACCRVAGLSEATIACLRADFPRIAFEPTSGSGFSAIWSDGKPDAPACEAPAAPGRDEGYALRIAPRRIHAVAHDAAGLWYACQAVARLRDRHSGRIPCADIADWPAIASRGIHIDLKGYQPRFTRLLELCRMLARHNVNTILLEIEDKYAFGCAPDAGIASAFTFAQLRALSEACAARFIRVIPKLQCLGHVDYLLKHGRYRPLREAGHPYQFCPLNADGLALWTDMAAELMDAFREHEGFHIGADEAMHLGQCPACRGRPRSELFLHRVEPCVDAVLARGRQPMMWEDILRNLHGHLTPEEMERTWRLGEKATLLYWAYGYGGTGNEFPFLARYLERGLKVWGASGYSGCGPSWIQNVPPLAERALNIAAWTRAAVEHRLPGVIATGWTRIASADPPADIPEASWFPVLYAAESMWAGAERDLPAFVDAAAAALFGAPLEPKLRDFVLSGAPLGEAAADVPPPPPRNRERLALLCDAARLSAHDRLRQDLNTHLHMYHGLLGRPMADYRREMIERKVAAFDASRRSCAAALRRALRPFYEAATVREVLQSRLGRDALLLTGARRQLRATPLI